VREGAAWFLLRLDHRVGELLQTNAAVRDLPMARGGRVVPQPFRAKSADDKHKKEKLERRARGQEFIHRGYLYNIIQYMSYKIEA
jgi:hypothetical protein